MTLTAPVKWAQRKKSIFVTIDLPDVQPDSAQVEIFDKKLVFRGKSLNRDYELELEFLHEIDSKNEETKYRIKPRDVSFYLVKKEEESWSRLLEDKTLQKTNVKVDFDKWVDEDDEGEGDNFNLDGMGGMPGMGGMGGMPGMGGMGGMPGMGGMGGMPGMEGMDMAKMMEQMKNMQGGGGEDFGEDDEMDGDGEEDDDEDGEGDDGEDDMDDHDHTDHGHSHDHHGHSHDHGHSHGDESGH